MLRHFDDVAQEDDRDEYLLIEEGKERRTMQNAGRNSPELLNTAGMEQNEECRTAPE